MKETILIVSNAKERWSQKTFLNVDKSDVQIKIDRLNKDQTIFGFGGAFTDAASVTYHSLSDSKRKEYIKAYYSMEGLGYVLGRYPIMSTDFSPYSYEYITEEGLQSFSLDNDKARLELVRDALSENKDIWITALPWSPCAFMKDNNDRCHGGSLLKEYYDLWSSVIVKAVQELDKEGVHIQCLSTQNEPLAKQTWESCIYTSEQEAIFLKDYLIPKCQKEGLSYMKFMIWDHNRDVMLKRTDEVLSYGVNEKDIFGVAYHWYDRDKFIEVKKTHDKYPNLHLLLTECCVELLCDDNQGLGSWENGLRYAINIINDLNCGSEGYIDWNLSLNLEGGPNHVGNFCEAPLLIDEKKDMIRYMPSYYIIGHFSKYLRPGDVRVSATSTDANILVTAFINERNEELKVVVLNLGDTTKKIEIEGKIFELQSKEIATLIL